MTDQQMEADYRRDQHDQARLRDLREHIAAFVDSPPARASGLTVGFLVSAARALGEDIARVDRVWD